MLVALVILIASATTSPVVTVEWGTASELNTAGFNLYRSDSQAGPFTRLNAEMIPASPDPLVGGSYIYTDTNVTVGYTYYYQLEEVETSGSSSTQGIVQVTAGGGLSVPILITCLAVVFAIIGLLWRLPRSSSTDRAI
jgi:hypothetical protein